MAPTATVPSAPAFEPPPLSALEVIPGYAGKGYGEEFLQAPPPSAIPVVGSMTVEAMPASRALTEEEARAALVGLVAKDCCWGKGPAESCKIVSMTPTTQHLVKIETFVETRTAKLAHKPYQREMFTGPSQGIPPQPWEVPVQPPAFFVNREIKVEIPFTSYIRPCHSCSGSGQQRCFHCKGHGHVDCSMCTGGRSHDGSHCMHCSGHGRKDCSSCRGGYTMCHHCQGQRDIRYFMELTVRHSSVVHEQVVGSLSAEVPATVLDLGTGVTMVNFSAQAVPPATTLAPEICNASSALLQQAAQHVTSSNGWQQQQRITVRAVPVTKVIASHNPPQEWPFWVIGDNKIAHCPDYPSQCCGCCTVM